MTVGDSRVRSESTPVSFYGLALRLRRGVSDIVTWSADRGSIPGTMTIGGDPGCDWNIKGPGIAPVELYVSAPDGRLRVKSARPGAGAKLDGHVLGDNWVSLDPGSRLEFGFACLALEFDAAPLDGGEAVREEAVAFFGSSLVDQARREDSYLPPANLADDEEFTPVALKAPRVPAASGTVRASRSVSQEFDREAARPSTIHRASARAKDVANVYRGQEPSSKKTKVVLYTMLAFLTLAAYGAWLFLLERF